jgi:hypothetical protein
MGRVVTTLLGLIVLVGLASYVYFVEWERPLVEDEKERIFTETAADDIEELHVTLAGAMPTQAKKVDGKWRLVTPVDTTADEGELSSMASSLATLDVQRVVEENATDLTKYALDPPRIEVAFRKKGQADLRRIQFGEKAPATGDLYARVPDSRRVVLVSSFLDTTFNKDTFALRDKTILFFDREKADRFTIATTGGTSLEFAKRGQDWFLTKPYEARADYGGVEGAIERLSSARMQGIVSAEGGDLKKYLLEPPKGALTVGLGSSSATLQMGDTANALLYARDASRPMVFTVAPTIWSDIVKDAADYRRKDLFDSRSFTASRVELTRGAEKIVLEKSTGADGKPAWKNAAGAVVDTAKVDDLLTKLTGIRAQSFNAAAHASLANPALTATVRFDPDRTETIRVGRAGSEAFASRPDEPGSATIELSAFDETMKALDALK